MVIRRPTLLAGGVLLARSSSSSLAPVIRQPKPIAARQFEIEFLDPGVEVFAFTFG